MNLMTSDDIAMKIKGAFSHHPSVEEYIREIEEIKKKKQINRFNYENVSNTKAINKRFLSE